MARIGPTDPGDPRACNPFEGSDLHAPSLTVRRIVLGSWQGSERLVAYRVARSTELHQENRERQG